MYFSGDDEDNDEGIWPRWIIWVELACVIGLVYGFVSLLHDLVGS